MKISPSLRVAIEQSFGSTGAKNAFAALDSASLFMTHEGPIYESATKAGFSLLGGLLEANGVQVGQAGQASLELAERVVLALVKAWAGPGRTDAEELVVEDNRT